MPAKRLSMRKIKEVLRLKWAKGLSQRRIAASCGIGRPTVGEYLRQADEAGLSWPLPDDLADAILDRLVHNAYKINLRRVSMRKHNAKLTTTTPSE